MLTKTKHPLGGPQDLITIGPEAQKMQWLAEARLCPWIVRVIPDGALDEHYQYPIKVEPLTSPVLLPLGAQERIKAFKDAPEVVTHIEDWWVVHEIVPPRKPWLTPERKEAIADGTITGLKILGVVALAALAVLAFFLQAVALVISNMDFGLCGPDPAILARVRQADGTFVYVECYRWFEVH